MQAVKLQEAICPRMGAYAAWRHVAAFISTLDPTRFGHVGTRVDKACVGRSDCPVDYMTVLGWDGYGIMVPKESFNAAVRSHADHSAVPTVPL